MGINVIYRSQFHEMGQGFHETAQWDSAIRNKFQDILVSIDKGACAVKNVIESIFWMSFIPDLNFAQEILIERPG
jgi:hypothetical protein